MGSMVLVGLSLTIVVGLVVFSHLVSRAHTVVRFDDGEAALERGALPPGLLSDLRDIARTAGGLAGHLAIRGQGDTLELELVGLTGNEEQRIRNVVLLRRGQIRRHR